MTLRAVRRWLWGAVAVAAGVLAGAAWIMPGAAPTPAASTTSLTPVGGEFKLVDEDGKPRTWADFRGKPVAVFFGFTHCPDICPTTLGELSVLLADLGPRSNDLQVVLVSGDPERDTPEVLNAYLQSFDPRIVGLTGQEAEVDRAFASFKAYRKKVPTEGGDYTVDHSAGVYLYDRDGGFAGTLDMHEDMKVRRQKVERLLAVGA
ncbi:MULTISPECIES: SCO family protein [unclassified Aureimonas]|uniref:SCO family protein n=1 Tax=unclassified Aureimonas TaxID=2615206 RepID=UPI0006F546C8|nr:MULTISPECIES: SCO family protein [unclassified Aureimonas]KQT56204.1 copper-binding protein [Aureimonas sp. Leaf427]KQT73229.1 copper-binding protein [Aureimonas sp. Leaf460]